MTLPSQTDTGVEWEMVVRWKWNDDVELDLRAFSATELEIKATTANACGAATGSRTVTFADVRAALDELERSAREIEKL